jgi:bifunctional polynucleotide phosphatase/kinase
MKRKLSSLDPIDGSVAVEGDRDTRHGHDSSFKYCVRDDTLLYCSYYPKGFDIVKNSEPKDLVSCKVAGFDLDQTLIMPSSGRRYPKDDDSKDWTWIFSNVPEKLEKLHREGFYLVIFTNQYGIGSDESGQLLDIFIEKVSLILSSLNLPIHLYAALGRDIYRKPRVGMWNEWVSKDLPERVSRSTACNQIDIDIKNSFFVGDAAGRERGWDKGRSADFADMDRKFAINTKLEFFTPDIFFSNYSHTLPELKFFPNDLLSTALPEHLTSYTGNEKCTIKLPSSGNFDWKNSLEEFLFAGRSDSTPEMVILVGPPGCGKTTLFTDIFSPRGYAHISQDLFKGNKKKCLASCKSSIQARHSVLIDNTNPSIKGRSEYINIAKEHGLSVRCIVLDSTRDLARHLNIYRSLTRRVEEVPTIAFNLYYKQFESPDASEGFSQIVFLPFFPRNVSHPELFCMHL